MAKNGANLLGSVGEQILDLISWYLKLLRGTGGCGPVTSTVTGLIPATPFSGEPAAHSEKVSNGKEKPTYLC